MGPEKRDTASGALVRPGRIPIPPTAALEGSKNGPMPSKSGIPSPRRRMMGSTSRLKDAATAAAATSPIPANAAKRLSQATVSKITKPLVRSGSSQLFDDKDDVRQRDSGTKDIRRDSLIQRDKAQRDCGPRKPVSTPEAGSQPDSGKRLLKQPSLLLKSSITNSIPAQTSSSVSRPSGPSPSSTATTVTVAAGKPVPRSVSTCRDRMSNDTRTSMMRRSMSVGKGRALMTTCPDQFPQQAGAKFRPIMERPATVAGAPYRVVPDKREASAGRIRPASAGGKIESALLSGGKSTLKPIPEAPARPPAQTSNAAVASLSSKPGPSKPLFSLNLAALKQQQTPAASSAPSAAPPAPATAKSEPPQPSEPAVSAATDDSGPPVPKLDLGGILQRRAEEQASEPVFMVAASSEDTGPVSASASQQGIADKRKSGSRQASAKEEPAEHFYLYPKVQPQEKKRIEEICRVVPKKQQAAITELFSKMVEARQNCEQMCFRGHRLLDQAQAEFRNRLAQKEEEVAQTREEAAQWRQEAEYLRTQLALLLSARPTEEGVAVSEAHKDQGATAEAHAAFLRSSLMATFDSMALLEGAAMRSFGGEAPAETYSAGAPTEAYGAEVEESGGEMPVETAAESEKAVPCSDGASMDSSQKADESDDDSDGDVA